MLPGDKPEPGGEIAPSFEDIHRRREGLDRQGGDWADARHCLQTPGRFSACRFPSCHFLKFGDGFRQPFDLIQKDTRQFHDDKRKRCRLILDRFFKNLHIRRPLRSHDTVLRQMTAERVYQLRALPDQRSRVRNSMARACCPSVLTATKRIVGRLAASAIASASAASFFWRLTKGLT